jgi:hypothetical protein
MSPGLSHRSIQSNLFWGFVSALVLVPVLNVTPLVAQNFLVRPQQGAMQNVHPPEPYRQIGSDPWVKFVLASANMYAVSSDPLDNGSAIVPLYTDYNAGGTYGTPDAITNFTPNDNNPDAAFGTSSYQMTWNGAGGNAYFQFDIGCTVANRPRDAANFGNVSRVSFYAKGDANNRQVEVLIFKRSSCTFSLLTSQWFTLSTAWSNYSIDISAYGLRPQDLHAVQFLMDSSHDSGGGTVLLDNVRLLSGSYDPLRGIQSYVANWADKNSDPNTPAGRDANLYPNHSYLYDNALAIEALLAAGNPGVAMNVADARMATATDCTSGFANQINSGHTLLSDGSARAPFNSRKRLGDNAWFGLALLDLYGSTSQTKYLTCARQISDWAENNLKASGQYEGYTGGYADDGSFLLSRSTEENADLFLLNSDLGVPYSDRAPWAATFVLAMYDTVGGKFWAGTSMDDTINTGSVPLDAQTLPFLTLGLSAQYHDAVNYISAITWAENNLVVTDNGFTGFTYSSNSKSQSPKVWLEGDAQVCLIYEILGQLEPASPTPWGAKAAGCIQTLQNASSSSGGILAASSDNLVDTVLNQFYDARQAIGPTAWAVFVRSLQGIR